MKSPKTVAGWLLYSAMLMVVTPPLVAVFAFCVFVLWSLAKSALAG